MEALQGLTGLLYLIVGTLLGIRLLRQAMRLRQLPELLLGLSFLCAGTLGSVLEIGSEIAADEAPGPGPGVTLAAGKVFLMIGLTSANAFTWRVFRADRVWAAGLVALLTGVQLVAFFGLAGTGSFSSGLIDPTWFWTEFAARMAGPAWMICECISYGLRMRRRVTLGLADPLVANRFLLWAVANTAGCAMLLTSVVPRLTNEQRPGVYLIFALAGFIAVGVYWLAFFPSRAYRRWIESASPG